MEQVRLWIAALMLLDAGLCLWFEERLAAWRPRLNLRRIAIIEGIAGLLIVAVHVALPRE